MRGASPAPPDNCFTAIPKPSDIRRGPEVKNRHLSLGLTVLVRVVVAVHVPVAELLVRMAREPVQAGPAASRAALLWPAAGQVHQDVLVVTPARATAWGSKAQVLAVAVICCAQVGSCGGRECLRSQFLLLRVPQRAPRTYQSGWTC